MNQSQRVLVAGTGISGLLLQSWFWNGAEMWCFYDGNAALKREEDIKEKFDRGCKGDRGAGEIKRSDLLGVELCIISRYTSDSPFVAVVDDAKIPILGEIELAYQCGLGSWPPSTGTNGKTTTTALTGEILKARYEETFVVGNIGDPYTSRFWR